MHILNVSEFDYYTVSSFILVPCRDRLEYLYQLLLTNPMK
jgi:hypothetical protein